MENINSYLKRKLKEKGLKVEDFIEKTNMSKSTIYRVMKGYQKPSDELFDKITEVLCLNASEQQELRYYSSISNVEEDIIMAREEIASILYGNTTPHQVNKLELVYYEHEKYIRTFTEILDSVVSLSSSKGFRCNFRIVNCCKSDIVAPLSSTISNLMRNKADYEIEHLISFSSYDAKENVLILKKTIPLLSLSNYSVMYNESKGTGIDSMFHDFLMLDYEYTDKSDNLCNKHLCFSFLHDSLSACFSVEDRNLREFFERNYEALRQNYELALNNKKRFEFIGSLFVELETNYDVYLFKPNPCYNRIPLSVYESIRERSSEEELRQFLSSFLHNGVDKESYHQKLDELFVYLKTRVDASFQNRQIDIFTQKGLESFASTGKLSDHLDKLPPLTSSEIKVILEYILSRNLDDKDGYKFYITFADYSNENLLISVFKDYGLLIEYNSPRYTANNTPYCLIEHKSLSSTFSDFAENYVPTKFVMRQDEAHSFIKGLIEKYC